MSLIRGIKAMGRGVIEGFPPSRVEDLRRFAEHCPGVTVEKLPNGVRITPPGRAITAIEAFINHRP